MPRHRPFLAGTQQRRDKWLWGALGGVLLLAGCDAPPSVLGPAGKGAEDILQLFWWLVGGGLLVWLTVVGVGIYAYRMHPEEHSYRKSRRFIIIGGAVLPVIILTGYLTYGLSMLPDFVEPAPEGSLEIAVSGEQWWWRVRYDPGGEPVEVANEIHLPVGEPVQFYLTSPDVIHSFWIPPLGGKMDMIPGRVTRLTLEPTKVGTFYGVCAEYCGSAHAMMRFSVVVQEKEDFERWLARQAAPAEEPETPLAARGREVFLTNGCGACHSVRGTPADGMVGPDLTHVGSRRQIGAGILPNEPAAFQRWIAHTEAVKPGVHMPAFGMLPDEEIRALAAYLNELE